MKLLRFRANQLRNLQDLDIVPSPGITVFQGPNASGKSSLLEGIHALSCGKSFRTAHLSQAIRHGADSMLVAAELSDDHSGVAFPIGIELTRRQSKIRMRVGGKPLQKVSELAALLPLITVHQESHRVFTEGPQYRRQFLDWGLFHVEQSFLPLWLRYRRALKQRNALLQRSAGGVEAWDVELLAGGSAIDAMRRRYLDLFMPYFQEMSDLLRLSDRIEAVYRPGWDESMPLGDALKRGLAADRALGYTRQGPHRADIAFMRKGSQVREDLSRGQMKTLVCALYLAQAAAFGEITGRRLVLLLDDLTAELDEQHSRRLLEKVHELDLQTFITSSETRLPSYLDSTEHKVFHVEHGVVTQ